MSNKIKAVIRRLSEQLKQVPEVRNLEVFHEGRAMSFYYRAPKSFYKPSMGRYGIVGSSEGYRLVYAIATAQVLGLYQKMKHHTTQGKVIARWPQTAVPTSKDILREVDVHHCERTGDRPLERFASKETGQYYKATRKKSFKPEVKTVSQSVVDSAKRTQAIEREYAQKGYKLVAIKGYTLYFKDEKNPKNNLCFCRGGIYTQSKDRGKPVAVSYAIEVDERTGQIVG